MGISDLFSRIPSRNELTGSFGEFLASAGARLFTDMLVMHDVLIEGSDGNTSQIDLLLIGKKGIYVVEVKTFTDAVIYGDGNKQYWYYYLHGRKFEIYSPIKQNKKHIKYLRDMLSDFEDIPMFSLIVLFCKDFNVSNINPPGVRETGICSSLPSMKKVLRLLDEDKPDMLDMDRMSALFGYINEHQLKGHTKRQEHKLEVKEYQQKLDEMKNERICPYCKAPLVLRKGKFGEFYGCSNYPKCRYTLKTDRE